MASKHTGTKPDEREIHGGTRKPCSPRRFATGSPCIPVHQACGATNQSLENGSCLWLCTDVPTEEVVFYVFTLSHLD